MFPLIQETNPYHVASFHAAVAHIFMHNFGKNLKGCFLPGGSIV